VEVKLFRKIFENLLSNATPARGTQILSRLISEMSKKGIEGVELDNPTLANIMLSECGVIGKKIAQGLAGLPWLKENHPKYAKSLSETQTSSTNTVPKRALFEYAEAEGLLDGSKGIKILSFDKLLGAASNKQACLITVEVTDSSCGLPYGEHQIVGKFKRPSAQKTQNLEHDLELAESILNTISEEVGDKVPAGFLDGIKYSFRTSKCGASKDE